MLTVNNLTVRLGAQTVVHKASFELQENQWLMVAGPNGAGKSSLANALACRLPFSGSVLLNGSDMLQEKPAMRAQKIGLLSQTHNVSYGFTVEEVVRLGRYAWGTGVLGGYEPSDAQHVEEALQNTGMTALRAKSVLALSGGELQRAFLAQVLAQNPSVLILDEPANHLDLLYQQQVFGLLAKWVQKPGRALISVVHDLSLAKAYGSHALLMNRGEVLGQGEVDTVLSRQNLLQAYNMDVQDWMHGLLAQWAKEKA